MSSESVWCLLALLLVIGEIKGLSLRIDINCYKAEKYTWMEVAALKIAAALYRSILSWTVILSVYGADTIAIDISFSVLIS
jgi:hypothetical protein